MDANERTAELLANLDWVQALARRLVRDPALAEDVAQETWLAAIERMPATVRERRSLRAWLAQVTRTLARQSVRAARRRSFHERAAPTPENRPESRDDGAELLARVTAQRRIVAVLVALEEPYRSTVLWRYFDGLSAHAIAARTGETPAAIRKRLERGLEKLRARLEGEFGERGALCAALIRLAGGLPAELGLTPVLVTLAVLVGGAAWIVRGWRAPPVAPLVVAAVPEESRAGTSPDALEESSSTSGRTALASISPLGARLALRGRVVDALERPIAGARVLAAAPLIHPDTGREVTPLLDSDWVAERFGPGAVRATECDERGEFALELPLTRRVRLAVRAPGFVDLDTELRHVSNDARLAAGPLHLQPAVLVHGQVVDASGAPVAGARIARANDYDLIQDRAGAALSSTHLATSDERGAFVLDRLPLGRTNLSIQAPGFAPRGLALLCDADEKELRVRLERGATISGRVTGAVAGRPLWIWVLPVARTSMSLAPCASDGSFVIGDLPADPAAYELRAYAEPRLDFPHPFLSETVQAQLGDHDVAIPLLAPVRYRIEVVDAATGDALDGVRLELKRRREASMPAPVLSESPDHRHELEGDRRDCVQGNVRAQGSALAVDLVRGVLERAARRAAERARRDV